MYNEDIHNLYLSPDIIQLIKLRRVKWDMLHIWSAKEMHTEFW
jgi:hypothetical protein